ncbi:MAG TPA: L,D-transpeptidase family protein [Allosphingosinicella sp.]|nr:L,D-transpeptidase family protein [Allosphingosinicella sp.]
MQAKFLMFLGATALLATTPLTAAPRGDEPIAVPRTVKQGIDFVYVDPEMSTVALEPTGVAKRHQRPRNWLQRLFSSNRRQPDARKAAVQEKTPHPLFLQLAQGLEQYQATWARLPQVTIPSGPALKRGSTGARIGMLRTRLGLPAGGYDEALSQAVMTYQRVHGLAPADGIAGKATLASLNRGADHYARRIAINMERAHRLPPNGTFARYVLVDSGAAEAHLFIGDRAADSMRVVVGAPQTATPIMAVLMQSAKANPYWNVPPELIRDMTAKRVRQQGVSYLKNFHYEVLSDWTAAAQPIDPKTVNWKQVAAGKSDVRVRQLPGPWNSMGAMKFEMPNDYGIYLHDTPNKELFAKEERWVSNGCVRLQDYRRFATWVFGRVPPLASELEQTIELPRPVPIYLTYLTVASGGNGVVFRPDPYGMDELAMPQMFGPSSALASAS